MTSAVATVPVSESPRLGAADLAVALGQPVPTAEQVEIIEAGLEPCLVIAGAGSGKTETMAARVVWLVVNGLVQPQEVLGLSFTRKASIELGDRIGRRLQTARRLGLWCADETAALGSPTVSTYHAYAGRLVGEHGLRMGVEPGVRLLTEAASWQLAHEVVDGFDGDMAGYRLAASTTVVAVLEMAAGLSEHLVEPAAARGYLQQVVTRLRQLPGPDHRRPTKEFVELLDELRDQGRIPDLVERYQDLKRQRGALDFADQMALAARLVRTHPVVGHVERLRFRAVLLDEFQDTSEAQMVLLAGLFAGHPMPLTAVGDPHQSIYGWRGASAGTLSRFPGSFRAGDQPARVLPLTTSWRNDQTVLQVANRAARPLREESAVEVEPLAPRPGADRGRVLAARLPTHVDEAAYLARWVRGRWLDADGAPTGATAAVLCRNRAQFDTVARALRDEGLPVEVVGLGGLLDAPEVIDLVSLLILANDPSRGDALMRLLTGPVCRLGAADVDALWAWAGELRLRAAREQDPPELSQAVHHPPPVTWTGPHGQRISATAEQRTRGLGATVTTVRGLAGLSLPDLVGEAERLLGLDIEVASDPDTPPSWGRAQLDALAQVAAGFESTADRPTLGGFVDWLEAARARERGLELAEVSVSRHAVQVLTVHAAKGLEWDAVAVPGLVEGTFPVHTARARVEDGVWDVREPGSRGWVGAAGQLPYPLRGDRASLPHLGWDGAVHTKEAHAAYEDFRLACGRHELAEERRLAYVAFTRSRRELLLTAPVWSTGIMPRVTSQFLTELLAEGLVATGPWAALPPTDPGRETNPLLDQELSAPWPVLPDERRRQVIDVAQAVLDLGLRAAPGTGGAGAPDDAVREQVDLLLAERAAARHDRAHGPADRLPSHLSTSALVELSSDRAGFLLRHRRPVPEPPAPAARAGTAFHAWVEQHYSAASLVDLDELPGAVGPGPDAHLAVLRANFLNSQWASREPLAVEVSVETVIAGQPVRGRIDAVFPDGAGGVVIVDWKTGRPGPPSEQRHRALQLAAYRLAYSRLVGLPIERVAAVFFHAATGETVRPDLPDEPALEAQVAALTGSGGDSGQRESTSARLSSGPPSTTW